MVQTTNPPVDTPDSRAEFDRRMMYRALELAAKGAAQVSPGPLVGCVIADSSGTIVGEGFYIFEDLHHAETIALAEAGDKAQGGTAYVTLEPHAHHGRTPPCTDALIAAGIERVVAPIEDLNPRVSGKGFAHLRTAGIDVATGVLAKEAQRLNEKYLHHVQTGLPFVHLKMAVSLDGKIATRTGHSRWIAGPESLARAQILRHEYDAILVGVGTALIDDPLLTDRSGLPRRRPLVRVVLDDRLELPLSSQLVKTAREAPLLVFADDPVDTSTVVELRQLGAEVVPISSTRDPIAVLRELADRSIQSILIEGGSVVAGNLFDAGLINKVTFFVSPRIIGGREAVSAVGGLGAETMDQAHLLENFEIIRRGDDIEVTGYPASR